MLQNNPKIFLGGADEQAAMVKFLGFGVNHSPFVFNSRQTFLTAPRR